MSESVGSTHEPPYIPITEFFWRNRCFFHTLHTKKENFVLKKKKKKSDGLFMMLQHQLG